MKPCIIESPWAHCVPLHDAYLSAAERLVLSLGFTPYASHRQLTKALDDLDPVQRELGIRAGIHMRDALQSIGAPSFFFDDFGVSTGMGAAWGTCDPRVRSLTQIVDPAEWDRIRSEAQYADSKFADALRGTAGVDVKNHCIRARERYMGR